MKSENFIRQLSNISISKVLLGLSILSLLYSVYHALFINITYDEAVSFSLYAVTPLSDIVSMKIPSANNHILNSILMRIFAFLFGKSVFVLRLPNLIAHFVFLTYLFLVLKKVNNSLLRVASFCLIAFNPFFLDLFTVARGYGLSLACVAAAMYYFIRWAKNKSNTSLILHIIALFFAIMANLNAIVVFISFYIVSNIVILNNTDLVKKRKLFVFAGLCYLIAAFVSFAVLYTAVKKLIITGQFYYGGEIGLINDTLNSVIYESIAYYSASEIALQLISVVLTVFILLSGIMLFVILIKNRREALNNFFFIFTALFFIYCLGLLILHFIFGALFPISRTASLFLLLLLFMCVFLLNNILSYKLGKGILITVSVFIIVLIIPNFVLSIDRNYINEWKFDADNLRMLSDVKVLISEEIKTGNKIVLGTSWEMSPSLNFYIYTLKLNYIKCVGNRIPWDDNIVDYVFVRKRDINKMLMNGRKPLKYYYDSGNLLMK